VTLAGVSERAGELTGRVNLESHVAETVELVPGDGGRAGGAGRGGGT